MRCAEVITDSMTSGKKTKKKRGKVCLKKKKKKEKQTILLFNCIFKLAKCVLFHHVSDVFFVQTTKACKFAIVLASLLLRNEIVWI